MRRFCSKSAAIGAAVVAVVIALTGMNPVAAIVARIRGAR